MLRLKRRDADQIYNTDLVDYLLRGLRAVLHMSSIPSNELKIGGKSSGLSLPSMLVFSMKYWPVRH